MTSRKFCFRIFNLQLFFSLNPDNNHQDDTPARCSKRSTKYKCSAFKAQSIRYHSVTTHPPIHHSQSSLDISQAATVRQSNPIPTNRNYAQYLTINKYRITHPTNQSPMNNTNNDLLDPITARTYLTSALSQFLGLTGTSISIDILKISSENATDTVWIRVPRPDGAAVVAALSSWIGGGSSGSGTVAWRVCGKGNFLNPLIAGDGADLFVP